MFKKLVAASVFSLSLHAALTNFQGLGPTFAGPWNDALCWSPPLVPDQTDIAVFGFLPPIPGVNQWLSNITPSGSAGRLSISGTTQLLGPGVLNLYPLTSLLGQVIYVSDQKLELGNQLNLLFQLDGTVYVDGQLEMTQSFMTSSLPPKNLSIVGAGSLTISDLSGIGNSNGAFNESFSNLVINSGIITNNGSIMNLGAANSASLLINGGSIWLKGHTGNMYGSSQGSITINNGSLLIDDLFGNISNSAVGTITINGGAVDNDYRFMQMYDNAKGCLNINNGSISNVFFIANMQDFAEGSISISGGEIQNSSLLAYILNNAKGSISISGGSITNSGGFVMLTNSALGSLNISGGTIFNTNQIFGLQGLSQGVLNISGGSITSTNLAKLQVSSVGTMTFSGGTIRNMTDMAVMYNTSQGYVNINGGSITNEGIFAAAFDSSNGSLNMTGGTVDNQSSFFGYGLDSVDFSGGYVDLVNAYMGACTKNSLTVSGSCNIVVDPLSAVGPAELKMTGGTITNNGLLAVDKLLHVGSSVDGIFTRAASNANISGGGLVGSGTVWVAGNMTVTAPINQSAVFVGFGKSTTSSPYTYAGENTLGVLSADSPSLNANFLVTGSGTLYAKGTIVGNVLVEPLGVISPGGYDGEADMLKIKGSLTLNGSSETKMDFSASGNDSVIIAAGGNLNLASSPQPILALNAVAPFSSGQVYTLFSLVDTEANGLSSGLINGSFAVTSNQPLVGLAIVYNSDSIQLKATTKPFITLAKTGNQKAVATVLDNLNGKTNECLQNKINELQIATLVPIDQALDTLDPAELKGQQIVLEEMSFVMNNELSSVLYQHNKGLKWFLTGGYERLSQDSFSQYNGFNSNSGYELIGLSYGFNKFQLAAAVGALETSTNYKNTPSSSSTASAIANLGFSGFTKHWSLGLDGLFGYHFIHTSRKILPFGLKALSNHEGYNTKVEATIAYSTNWDNTKLTPYEKIAYNYTHENSFTEHGASCLDLEVDSSNRNMLRNTLGIKFETNLKRGLKRRVQVLPYVDASWVWENRFNGLSYKAKFVDTDQVMTVRGVNITRNFGKLEAGLVSRGKLWSGKLSFNGMWGQRFSEMGASLLLDRKF